MPNHLTDTSGACFQYLWTGTALECRQFAVSRGMAREQNILLLFHKGSFLVTDVVNFAVISHILDVHYAAK